MRKFSKAEKKQRAFKRVAWVLRECYEESWEEFEIKRATGVHTRIFETMIPYEYVKYGKSFNVDLNIGKGHKEQYCTVQVY